MAYVKNIWVDQDVERPKTYEVTNNQDGSITLTDSFGLVTELGTPVNEVNMNHIEDGIEGCAIRKHNLTETFNLGEWVLGGTGDDEGIYKSLVSNNVGNAITDDTKWEKVEMGGGASRNIGEIVASTIPLTDAVLHLLDGSLLSYGSYQDFIDYIADLYESGDYPDLFETEANWQQSVTTYGVCGKFVYDSVNNTVRLPKITGIVEGTTDLTALGDLVEAGLPNITGSWRSGIYTSESATSGAIYGVDYGTDHGGSGSTMETYTFNINASRSSSIYGNSSTVQPQTIKVLYYIVLATSTKTEIEVDIDEIATDLNGKMDTDLSNMSASVSAKSLITSWGVPDYANRIVGDGIASDTWTQVLKDSFVYLWVGDPYAEQYTVWVSANQTTLYEVGYRYDDTNSNTETQTFSFFVPKNWYFMTNAEQASSYRICPLKGAN